MSKWVLGTVYDRDGSCSSEQARSMPYWAETQVARYRDNPPAMVVVVGLSDSCQPAINKAFHGFAEVVWVDLLSSHPEDGLSVIYLVARLCEATPVIVSCKLEDKP